MLIRGVIGTCLEVRPLPSTDVTRLQQYYEPLRLPHRPGPALTSLPLIVQADHRCGSPVLRGYRSCRVPSSLPRRNRSGLLIGPTSVAFPFRWEGRLPQPKFSRPARRSLTLWPADSLSCQIAARCHRRLSTVRCLPIDFDCFLMVNSFQDGIRTHRNNHTLPRRTSVNSATTATTMRSGTADPPPRRRGICA